MFYILDSSCTADAASPARDHDYVVMKHETCGIFNDADVGGFDKGNTVFTRTCFPHCT